MDVRLAYGSSGLVVDLPSEQTTVIEPRFSPAPPDQAGLIRDALREPISGERLGDLVTRGQRVAISVCDITRPQPRRLVLPLLLDELSAAVDLDDVVVLVATGTHRANSDLELEEMFGQEVLRRVRVINHVATNKDELTWCGTLGRGVPVWLNSEWVNADVRITTGFVEPHFFAGFSGGPKMVAPGLAGLDTVLTLHDAVRIGDAHATWGVLDGNPVHEDIAAIAKATGVTFALDVVLNRDQDVIAAYSGELFAMHRAATEFVRTQSMRAVDAPFDVVITSNSGYPLDQNLYQAVKGMSAAAEIVKDGGLIICAAECRDGFPDHGGYRALLSSAGSPRALLDAISARETTVPDQWQVQIQAKVQSRVRVVVHTSYLSDEDAGSAHLEQTSDVSAFVRSELARLGPEARVCVLPEGPQTIPYIATAALS